MLSPKPFDILRVALVALAALASPRGLAAPSSAKCQARLLVQAQVRRGEETLEAMRRRGVLVQGFPKVDARTRLPVSDFSAKIAHYEHFIRNHRFAAKMSGRGMSEYTSILGTVLPATLAALPPDAHWLDLGAGEFAAQREARRDYPLLWLTAVAAVSPQNEEAASFLSSDSRFRFVEGIFTQLEPASFDSIPPADLITDVYGALTYEVHIDTLLRKAVGKLKPGGRLLLHATKYLEFARKGQSLAGWLLDIEGLDVVDPVAFAEGEMALVRTEQPLRVPELRLVRFASGSAGQPIPWRVYDYAP